EALLEGVVVEAELSVGRVRVAMSERTPGLHAIVVVPALVNAGPVAHADEWRQGRPGCAGGEDEHYPSDPRQSVPHRVRLPRGAACFAPPSRRAVSLLGPGTACNGGELAVEGPRTGSRPVIRTTRSRAEYRAKCTRVTPGSGPSRGTRRHGTCPASLRVRLAGDAPLAAQLGPLP